MGDSQNQDRTAVEAGSRLLAYIQRFNWILLAVLFAGAWYIFSWPKAQSVLIGGLLANASFFLLRRDIVIFMDNFSQAGMSFKAVKKLEKIKFFVKFYGRLALLALVLYLLITRISIDVIAMLVGLSTIMFSIIVVIIGKGSTLYSAQRFKGA